MRIGLVAGIVTDVVLLCALAIVVGDPVLVVERRLDLVQVLGRDTAPDHFRLPRPTVLAQLCARNRVS